MALGKAWFKAKLKIKVKQGDIPSTTNRGSLDKLETGIGITIMHGGLR